MVRPQPLKNRRIVVTAPGRLAARLRDLGAAVVEIPVIAIEGKALDGVSTGGYDWLVFSSANAVEHFCPHLPTAEVRGYGQKVAAVGPATADALRERGIEVDLVPGDALAEALVDAFPDGSGRVLLPQAAAARPVLADGLRAKGWDVDVAVAYETVAVPVSDEQRAAAASADAITFTSSSTVTNYLDAGAPVPPVVACIGPVTAGTARDRRLDVSGIAEPHTVGGLVELLVALL